jgi:hypothetical protein
MEITKSKFDNRIIGIILGAVLPVILFFVQLNIKGYAFSFVKDAFKDNKPFVAGLFTICLIVNAILFGVLIQFKKQRTAIGLFIPTALLGLLILLYKFID